MPEDVSGLVALPQDTVSLLKSSQVVTSVWSAVKELVENSLDAGATNIEVRLEDYGLSKVSVRDNGSGVEKQDVPSMVLPHTTSKLREFTDLSNLQTYGFRGEALASLCGVACLSITTRTTKDLAATTFTFTTSSMVKAAKTCAGKVGTEVLAENLFVNLPVRRNYYKNIARKKEELKKVERLIQAFSVINISVRFSLYHNKSQLCGSLITDSIAGSLAGVLGRGLVSSMEPFTVWVDPDTGELVEAETGLSVEGMVPSRKVGMGAELGRCSNDKTWVFVNKRPVEMKEVEKLAKELFSAAGRLESEKFPVCCISISLSGSQLAKLDQNLEPNKQKVGLGSKKALLKGLEYVLKNIWNLKDDTEEEVEELDDTYGEMLKEGRENISDIPKNMKPPAETCFTTIGQTQQISSVKPITADEFLKDNVNDMIANEESKISEGKEADSNLQEDTVSQFFKSEPEPQIENEAPAADFDLGEESISQFFKGADNSSSTESSAEPRSPEHAHRARSPVLRKSMFDSPELPGVDAVYINMLKDGDGGELFDDYDLDEPLLKKERPRNPFISYECEEGSESPVKAESRHVPTANGDHVDVGDKFAKGQLLDQQGSIMQPVKLLPPPSIDRTPRSEPVKRKYNPDESVIKIDDFLAKRAKTRKGCVGDQTLAGLAAPYGTPVLKVKKHILNRARVDIPFNIAKCLQKTEEVPSTVVGPLMSGWVAKDEDDLVLIFPPRIREMLLYERLLTSHVLPSEKISEPVTIFPGLLSKELAEVAISMFTNTRQCPAKITDRRITYNGFSVGLYHVAGNPSSYTLKLEARCPLIQYIGVEDLVEILRLVRDQQIDSVRDTRPGKVKEYLAGEASRMSKEVSAEMDRDAMEDMLVGWKDMIGAGNTCLHGKEILRSIGNFRKGKEENYVPDIY